MTIEEIKARREKVTPGDWMMVDEGTYDAVDDPDTYTISIGYWVDDEHFATIARITKKQVNPRINPCLNDATAFAHYKSDIDWLIAEVERKPPSIDEDISAGKQLDKIYHALPGWVNTSYHDSSLAERIGMMVESFEHCFNEEYRNLKEEKKKLRNFISFLVAKLESDQGSLHWEYLMSRRDTEKEELKTQPKGTANERP